MGHPSNGQDFADKLVTFVSNMKNQGIPIYAVSSQNEPDANVTCESCSYTGTTLTSFVETHMGPVLRPTGVKIMSPEAQDWCWGPSFLPGLRANSAVWSVEGIVATHEYGCNPGAHPAIAQAGKEFWESEITTRTAPQTTAWAAGFESRSSSMMRSRLRT